MPTFLLIVQYIFNLNSNCAPLATHELHWDLVLLLLCLQDVVSSSTPSERGKDEKSKPKEDKEEHKKWAIPVNINAPCDDFYKRIPNPAFKVGILEIIL